MFKTCFTAEMNVVPGESSLATLLKLFSDALLPACTVFKDYAFCRPEQKLNFLHGLGQFVRVLKSNHVDLSKIVDNL